MVRSLISGVVSGMAGLVAFLVVHHVWIAPIWFVAPMGVATAAVGGLAIGWSYEHVHEGFASRELWCLTPASAPHRASSRMTRRDSICSIGC
jgi:hypothetical protein